jgi:hypothetical protein
VLSVKGSSLVAGGTANPDRGQGMNTIQVKVTRAFHRAGKVFAVGTVVDMPDSVASELVAMNKAELVPVITVAAGHKETKQEAQVEKDEREATTREAKGKDK